MANRYLIVEDDATILKFIESALHKEGHEVLTARSIAQAQARLSTQPEAADCLVIDVVLQGESGIDLAQQMLKQHPGLRVLFISGFTDDVVVIEPEFAQRTAFLAKPFGRDALIAALDRVCS